MKVIQGYKTKITLEVDKLNKKYELYAFLPEAITAILFKHKINVHEVVLPRVHSLNIINSAYNNLD